MRVCHIITRLCIGGAQENTLLSVRGLLRLGYDVCLLYGPAAEGEGSLQPWVRRHRLPAFRLDTFVRQPRPLYDSLTLRALYRFLKPRRFDLVHTHTSKAGVIGRIAARVAGVPMVVHTPHGHVFHSYFNPLETWFYLTLERSLARVTDCLIALTETERREHLDLGIGRRTPFAVIHSGVTPPPPRDYTGLRRAVRAELGISSESPVVGTVARLAPVKGLKHLLGAFGRLLDARGDAYLVCVGDGPERGALEGRARALGLEGHVRFVGFQSDVWKYLATFDAFALPSLNEGMGKVLIQAAFMQVPVVASAVGGVKDLIQDGVTGFLVRPRDEAAMAKRLEAVLGEPARAGAMAREAHRRLLSRYSEAAMVRRLDRLYRWLRTKRMQ